GDVWPPGFSWVAGEWQRDVNAIATTIRVRDELYGISCGAPAYFLREKRLREEIAPRFLEIVAAIEDRLLMESDGQGGFKENHGGKEKKWGAAKRPQELIRTVSESSELS